MDFAKWLTVIQAGCVAITAFLGLWITSKMQGALSTIAVGLIFLGIALSSIYWVPLGIGKWLANGYFPGDPSVECRLLNRAHCNSRSDCLYNDFTPEGVFIGECVTVDVKTAEVQ